MTKMTNQPPQLKPVKRGCFSSHGGPLLVRKYSRETSEDLKQYASRPRMNTSNRDKIYLWAQLKLWDIPCEYSETAHELDTRLRQAIREGRVSLNDFSY